MSALCAIPTPRHPKEICCKQAEQKYAGEPRCTSPVTACPPVQDESEQQTCPPDCWAIPHEQVGSWIKPGSTYDYCSGECSTVSAADDGRYVVNKNASGGVEPSSGEDAFGDTRVFISNYASSEFLAAIRNCDEASRPACCSLAGASACSCP